MTSNKFSIRFKISMTQVNEFVPHLLILFYFNVCKLFDYIVDKLKDSTRYMIRADQQGAKIVKIFNVVFMAGIPINITMNSIGSVFYCKWKYGYIDPHHLYRAYRFMYA